MRNRPFSRTSRGFTLVELMVGVLIGLIGTVVIFQVFAVSESQKRTTTGGSDAQQNGVFGLFQIERDMRMAGYGLNYMALLGCPINGWYEPGGAADPVQARAGRDHQRRGRRAGRDPPRLRQLRPLHGARPSSRSRWPTVRRPTTRWTTVRLQRGRPRHRRRGRQALHARAGEHHARDARQSDNVVHNSGNYTNHGRRQRADEVQPARRAAGPRTTSPYNAWNPATSTGGRLYNLGAAPTVVTYPSRTTSSWRSTASRPAWRARRPRSPTASCSCRRSTASTATATAASPRPRPAPSNVTLGANTDQWADNMPVAATGAGLGARHRGPAGGHGAQHDAGAPEPRDGAVQRDHGAARGSDHPGAARRASTST